MNRTEKYERGLSMTNRIFELETIHNWSDLETKTALAVLDEQLPITLHNLGEHPLISFAIITDNIHTYSFPTRIHAPSWSNPLKKICFSYLHSRNPWLLPPNRTWTWHCCFS